MSSRRRVVTEPPPGVDVSAILAEEAHRAAVGEDRRQEAPARGEDGVLVRRGASVYHAVWGPPCAPKPRYAVRLAEAEARRQGYRPCGKCRPQASRAP